ncbi:NHL repeat domain protein [Minicystis rosea]|nr:NHL repeat domain protein [Minicystis rosea]
MGTREPVSTYTAHLPAILQQGAFIGQFLRAFEAIFAGGVAAPADRAQGDMPKGLEETLDRVHEHFDPSVTPEGFLTWLSQWVATSLRDDWTVETKRAFLGEIVSLYRKRGTRAGIEAVLGLCTSADVEIVSDDDAMPRHHFDVILTVSERDPVKLSRMARQVRAIVDREKPAHTIYGLKLRYPAMRIARIPTESAPGITLGTATSVLGTVTATLAQRQQP